MAAEDEATRRGREEYARSKRSYERAEVVRRDYDFVRVVSHVPREVLEEHWQEDYSHALRPDGGCSFSRDDHLGAFYLITAVVFDSEVGLWGDDRPIEPDRMFCEGREWKPVDD